MAKPLIVITGSSAGIGAATARIFSEAEYPVALFSRNKEESEKLKLRNSISISVDVTDHEAFKEALQRAEKQFGAVDCLINNAGYACLGDFLKINHHDIEEFK